MADLDCAELSIPEGQSYDLRATFVPLHAGGREPTMWLSNETLVRATRTPDGPATLCVRVAGDARLSVAAHGPGRRWLLERAASVLGLDVPPPECAVDDRVAQRLRRAALGVRMPRTGRVVEMLTLIVLQQKVRGREAQRCFRYLVERHSEPAPGPFPGLLLPLAPDTLRRLPLSAYYEAGVLSKQAVTLRELGFRAKRLEEVAALDVSAAAERLAAVDGIGPWSVGEALLRGLGAPDAVPVGDYHLPDVVAYNLAGEERADDARMLELLEPHRGQRGWLLRWIIAAGRMPPRRGPRRPMQRGPRGRR